MVSLRLVSKLKICFVGAVVKAAVGSDVVTVSSLFVKVVQSRKGFIGY